MPSNTPTYRRTHEKFPEHFLQFFSFVVSFRDQTKEMQALFPFLMCWVHYCDYKDTTTVRYHNNIRSHVRQCIALNVEVRGVTEQMRRDVLLIVSLHYLSLGTEGTQRIHTIKIRHSGAHEDWKRDVTVPLAFIWQLLSVQNKVTDKPTQMEELLQSDLHLNAV